MASNADAEALFAAHQTGLLRYLRRAVGHTEAARDLTQDVFVRIARADALPATDDERRAWVFRIARNLAIDHRRRHEVRLADSATGRADAGRPAAQDTSLAVNEALAALDALDRDVFLLREASGLSYAEIAAACDLSVSAVRSRIHRARLELRERLRDPIAAVLAKNKRMTMDTHEVVSAFLDDEPFDPADLAAALADPGGRQLLLDLVALRTLVRDEPIAAPARAPGAVSRPAWIAVGFLAASVVFGAGAAWLLPPLLQQRHADVPPTPTRVVTFDTAAAGGDGSR